jgi:hypothetical protein
MIRDLSFSLSAVLSVLLNDPCVAHRASILDSSNHASPPASREPTTVNRQRSTGKVFDPHSNDSRSRDMLAMPPHAPRYQPSVASTASTARTANCQPSTFDQRAFDPHLNYSRSRAALTLRVHGHRAFLASGPLFTAREAFEPYSNYSRSRDASRGLCTARRQRCGKRFESHSNYSPSRDISALTFRSLFASSPSHSRFAIHESRITNHDLPSSAFSTHIAPNSPRWYHACSSNGE